MSLGLVSKLSAPVRWLKAKRQGQPAVGRVNLGSLGRIKPISQEFGFDRGLPVDRYYIENFLKRHASDIQGHVLEIKEPLYTYRFGGDRVTKSDILHVEAGNPQATLVADLTQADHLPSATFDCIIFTQTLQFIYDAAAAVKTLHRILKPGGVLLATVSGISQISKEDMENWGQYWSFTDLSIQRLFEDVFEPTHVDVTAYGNVLGAIAFLHGLAIEELETSKLDHHDPEYQVLISARAVK
ncbi:MAG: methyltransferase domain-containing protein [Cyanobacteria bacterium P01_F01_bin.4]